MYSDYYPTYKYPLSGEGLLTTEVILTIMILALVFGVGMYVLMSFAFMRIFKKAGLPAWKAWVPYYNNWLFLELGGYNGALSLLMLGLYMPFVPVIGFMAAVVGFVFDCLAAKEISAKLNKSNTFILFPLGIATFGITSIIWYFMVASGDNQWNDAAGKESLAKGTILGYKIVEEEKTEGVKEEKTPDTKEEKTEE